MTRNARLLAFLLFGWVPWPMPYPVGLAHAGSPDNLQDAALRGDLRQLDALLQQGADVNARTESGRNTALHLAALQGNWEAVDLLLRRGAQVAAKNAQGHTPLHWAALCVLPDGASGEGRTRVVRLLLEQRADPNAKDDKGQTPLHWGLQRTVSADVADYLLGFGVTLQGKEGLPASDRKAIRCSQSAISALIDHRADLYARTNGGRDVIDLAIASRQPELVRQLLAAGLNLGKTAGGGKTLVLAAALSGEPDTVRVLVARGLSVNQRDQEGSTALHVAAGAGLASIVAVLLDLGAEVNARNDRSDTPLDLTASDEVRLLLKARGARTGHPIRLHV